MAELKGLLDSAKRKLGGLLGDFPAGFNSGAVAGIAGYPGDIAYMLDTAGRAITGQDTQPAAQDFPGTTDYIAAKAGYPIPGSFSGQLGAAVGGMLTPGPGDLAKFAPVLSAIPFWHGSPHKYDAVDLSKIGTGEGAQAYGWGYYGAGAKDTAEQYAKNVKNDAAITDVNAELSRLAKIMGEDEMPGSYRKYRSQKGADAAAEYDRLLSVRQGVVDDPGQMYRGEYRWPDPAKEAATPLTGEDLLQWDRPLSEQPSILAKLKADGFAIADDATLTGEDFYTRLQREVGGEPDEISQSLNAAGVPGIRYLDGMSRDGGQGTYNYVMFDDKGIKLLERNGSPLQAADVRFDDSKTWYHTTTEDFTEFDPSKGSKTAAFGPGIYVSEDVNDSARWAKSKDGARTIAVQLAPEHILSGPLSEKQAQQLSAYLGREVKAGDPIPYLSLERRGGTVSEGAKAAGFAGVEHYGSGAGANAKNIVITDPPKVKIIDHGRNGSPIEDFAARRAGKAKPYREATGQRTLQDVVSELEQRGITVDAAQSGNNPDLVTLSRIVVPQEQRGQGVGTQAMQDLIGYADEQGKTIALSPSADFGASSVDRLKDFYKRFGFVDNKGKGRDFEISESMYRRGGK